MLFEICKEKEIHKVILASSIMTVWGKFADEKEYLRDTIKIQKVSSNSICLPKDVSPPLMAYIKSKIKAEQTSLLYYQNYSISSVCVRIGAVSSDNLP
jgi:nucleoside-diphosphate-sugar epimerase